MEDKQKCVEVTLESSGGAVQFLFDGSSNPAPFEIQAGTSLCFTLDAKKKPKFVTYPVQWFEGHNPSSGQPDDIDATRKGDGECSISVGAKAKPGSSCGFALCVVIDDKVYGSNDPTIIILPPTL